MHFSVPKSQGEIYFQTRYVLHFSYCLHMLISMQIKSLTHSSALSSQSQLHICMSLKSGVLSFHSIWKEYGKSHSSNIFGKRQVEGKAKFWVFDCRIETG